MTPSPKSMWSLRRKRFKVFLRETPKLISIYESRSVLQRSPGRAGSGIVAFTYKRHRGHPSSADFCGVSDSYRMGHGFSVWYGHPVRTALGYHRGKEGEKYEH